MTENQKKGWTMALVVVPALISGFFSYAGARSEAKDESKASYEALRGAFEDLKKDSDENRKHVFVLEGQLKILTDLVEKSNQRVSLAPGLHPLIPIRPSADAGVDGDGIHDKPEPFVHRKSDNTALPTNFEDVVQRYKAKK